jgi:hypothetical protein
VSGGGNWERSDRELRGSGSKPAACSIGNGIQLQCSQVVAEVDDD